MSGNSSGGNGGNGNGHGSSVKKQTTKNQFQTTPPRSSTSKGTKKNKGGSKAKDNSMNDQWLNQMEITTYSPDQAPMWARPGVHVSSLSSLKGDDVLRKKKTNGGGATEKGCESTTPWWWNIATLQPQHHDNSLNTTSKLDSHLDRNTKEGDKLRVVQLAMATNMFT